MESIIKNSLLDAKLIGFKKNIDFTINGACVSGGLGSTPIIEIENMFNINIQFDLISNLIKNNNEIQLYLKKLILQQWIENEEKSEDFQLYIKDIFGFDTKEEYENYMKHFFIEYLQEIECDIYIGTLNNKIQFLLV